MIYHFLFPTISANKTIKKEFDEPIPIVFETPPMDTDNDSGQDVNFGMTVEDDKSLIDLGFVVKEEPI